MQTEVLVRRKGWKGEGGGKGKKGRRGKGRRKKRGRGEGKGKREEEETQLFALNPSLSSPFPLFSYIPFPFSNI